MQFADAARGEAVGSDAACRRIDGATGGEGCVQCGCGFRFDGDDLGFSGIPSGDAADQTAAADGNEERVDAGCVGFKFQADRALTQQRFGLIEGMHAKCAGLGGAAFACG